MAFGIDVNEGTWSNRVLEILLIDRTTNRNILWATEDYEYLGEQYNSRFPIEIYLITGKNSNLIKPRIAKNKEEQGNRTKGKAEVFTPSWICNEQNNLIDNSWFDRENVFNTTCVKSWCTTKEKIKFPDNSAKSWEKYVDEKRMEITCGEAPYLVSRYDMVTGEIIELNSRIGLLDRKMRLVHENTYSEQDWLKWSRRAFESVYAFEFQGDNLLLARENLLISYIDYMYKKLNREPVELELQTIATIISWNVWQMDGLTYTIPYQKHTYQVEQISLFEHEQESQNEICKIKDWRRNKIIKFSDLLNTGGNNGKE